MIHIKISRFNFLNFLILIIKGKKNLLLKSLYCIKSDHELFVAFVTFCLKK